MILERFQAANAAADDDAETIAIHLVQVDPAVCHGHLRGRHGELREAVGAPDVLRIFEVMFRFEIPHLAANLAIVTAGIEGIDVPIPLTPFFRLVPEVARSFPTG